MAKYPVLNLGSLNLKVSPFLQKPGDLIRCVNLEKDQVGSLKKRPGYSTFLGTTDGSAVTDLWSWTMEDGTSTWVYRNSGGKLYYWNAGVGTATVWTLCGNGTMTASSHIGNAVLEDEMIIGDGASTTRYTSDGTAFTTITAAPKVPYWTTSTDNRVYGGGTSSDLFYCTAGTINDWTTDSSSLKIPGPGKINQVWFCNDRVVVSKNSNQMFTYDSYNLRRVPTNQSLSSPYSLGETEDYWFYLNRQGGFGYNGNRPELLSNAIEKQVYNDDGTGIAGTVFDTAPGVAHRYDYLLAVGDVTDDLTDETVSNCIFKYDYQLDEWSNYSFAALPTTWTTYKDNTGVERLIFGDSTGQGYTFGGTMTSDNITAIEAVAEGVLAFEDPAQDKHFRWLTAFASPGCQAKIAVAIGDSFEKTKKKWIDIGDLITGCREFRFPANSRGKLLFWKLYETGADTRFHFYGFEVNLVPIGKQ